jgi:hypothetical protein
VTFPWLMCCQILTRRTAILELRLWFRAMLLGREMRGLLRKYPTFTDMRAGLAAALWGAGLEGQAETQWCAHLRLGWAGLGWAGVHARAC